MNHRWTEARRWSPHRPVGREAKLIILSLKHWWGMAWISTNWTCARETIKRPEVALGPARCQTKFWSRPGSSESWFVTKTWWIIIFGQIKTWWKKKVLGWERQENRGSRAVLVSKQWTSRNNLNVIDSQVTKDGNLNIITIFSDCTYLSCMSSNRPLKLTPHRGRNNVINGIWVTGSWEPPGSKFASGTRTLITLQQKFDIYMSRVDLFKKQD